MSDQITDDFRKTAQATKHIEAAKEEFRKAQIVLRLKLQIGEHLSQRFADYLARQEISDEDWEREIQAAISEAFNWAWNSANENGLFQEIEARAHRGGWQAVAKWHEAQCQEGHCGEDTTEKIIRQRRNIWHRESAAGIRTEARKNRLKDIVAMLEAEGMRCNCDLDNWVPEIDTGHSWVCRINEEAVRRYEEES